MKSILSESYGVMTYQDDVMLVAIELAGYSWLEADKLRKAMGKKIPAEMESQKEKLMKGLIKNGLSDKKAEELWKLIEPFAAYGFNKAHAASYGKVAYQTAYMKANFPAIYMSAVLTADSGDVEKISEIITECKRMQIPVLAPDINESGVDFAVVKADKANTAEKDQIRFGLYTIKNLGAAIADAIIATRENGGKFTSYTNFLERVNHKDLNKKSLESLIRSGVFDSLGEERGALLYNIDEALEYHRVHTKEKDSAQSSLFSLMESAVTLPVFRLKKAPEASKRDKLGWEKELLGLYISGHPLEEHKEKLEKGGVNIKTTIEKSYDGATAVVGGIIEDLRMVITKKNEHMAFVRIADFTGTIEVVVFPRTFTEIKDILLVDKCVVVKGRFSKRNDSPSVIAEKIKSLD
jgi:DNA polymerase-3 subunit alpha